MAQLQEHAEPERKTWNGDREATKLMHGILLRNASNRKLSMIARILISGNKVLGSD